MTRTNFHAFHATSALVVGAIFAIASCGRNGGDANELKTMALTSALLPASPTNAHASDPLAAALGQRLFFDRGFSSEGTIACASCHDPDQGFSDPKPRSLGVRGQTGDRHAMPITAAVFHPFLLWDGKADAVWLQPLKALENPKEMDFTRVEVAHRIATVYAADYQQVFGALPDLSHAPPRAMPGLEGWDSMPESLRDDVQRVFSNVGKALEAYERQILCTDTRFDKWARGEIALTDAELSGANTFRGEGCDGCHSGPSFSDGGFHNIGIPSADRGRAVGAPALLTDPFNGAGRYSDDTTAGLARLQAAGAESGQEGAFRTASLRGVGQRRFFGHAAHQETLRGFVLDIYTDRRRRAATVGTLDPKLERVDVNDDDVDDIVAFLHTLDCPPLPASLRPAAGP